MENIANWITGVSEAVAALFIFLGGMLGLIVKWKPLRDAVVFMLRASVNHHDRELLATVRNMELELAKLQKDVSYHDDDLEKLVDLPERVSLLEFKMTHIMKLLNCEDDFPKK